jgi:hypothetical protein
LSERRHPTAYRDRLSKWKEITVHCTVQTTRKKKLDTFASHLTGIWRGVVKNK